jgi:hypothetical protein
MLETPDRAMAALRIERVERFSAISVLIRLIEQDTKVVQMSASVIRAKTEKHIYDVHD